MNTILENLLSVVKKLTPIKTKTTTRTIIVRGTCSLCGKESVIEVDSFTAVKCPYCFPKPEKIYIDELHFDIDKPQRLLKRKPI